MKRMAISLILVFVAASLFAGGKECDMSKHAAKSVELNGTIAQNADGDSIFRVANSDQTYTICEKTKEAVLKVSGPVHVKGKIVSCGNGEELMIDSAKKI
ncbi:MAG TPA: hypothetical protein VMU84_05350 [Thermoanaerobaculia bacterium]|nr:hypothetical protein [Thermoanaerobaculia bacterium]